MFAVVAAIFVTCGGILSGLYTLAVHGYGPSREAEIERLTAALRSLPGPEGAEEAIEEAHVKRFPDGSWVVGVGIDSHSWKRARSTLVLRDSRGQVRVIVGHVCGPHWLAHNLIDMKSLDEFYERLLRMNDFREYSGKREALDQESSLAREGRPRR